MRVGIGQLVIKAIPRCLAVSTYSFSPLPQGTVLAQAFGSVPLCHRGVEGDRPVPKTVLEALSR